MGLPDFGQMELRWQRSGGNETQIHIQIPSIRQNLVYRQNDVVLVEEGATFAIGLPPERCHLFREDGTACRRLHKEPGV